MRSSKRSRSTRTSPRGCAQFRHKSLDYFLARPMPTLGRRPLGDRLRQHLLLHSADREAGRTSGRTSRPRSSTPGTGSASPRRRRSTSPASGRSTSRRSSTTSSRRTSRRKGVIFLDMDSGLREHEELVKQYFCDDHPAERQQVRRAQLGRLVGRFVHLRAAGSLDRDAPSGLLPHQRGEHGPVRAHADHRRRGRVRALRRGLHRADLLLRLAAFGGRRDRRQEGRPLPLHDDPELVEQRLQPRHEARRRVRERDDGVGRRKPRLEGHDEVPRRFG